MEPGRHHSGVQGCLHVRIGNHCYGAFGNLFLLRWARKIQVLCHRKHPVTGQPYDETADYADDCRKWEVAIKEGCTVIVTPGISGGERLMKKVCMEKGFPLIHLQKEPIGAFWKPERQRFDACTNGSLLILAPWDLDMMGDVGESLQRVTTAAFIISTCWPLRFVLSMVRRKF